MTFDMSFTSTSRFYNRIQCKNFVLKGSIQELWLIYLLLYTNGLDLNSLNIIERPIRYNLIPNFVSYHIEWHWDIQMVLLSLWLLSLWLLFSFQQILLIFPNFENDLAYCWLVKFSHTTITAFIKGFE